MLRYLRRCVALQVCVVVGIAGQAPGQSVEPSIAIEARDGEEVIVVQALPPRLIAKLKAASPDLERWREVFAVHAVEEGGAPSTDQPGVLGRYSVIETEVVFRPRYRLSPRVSYHVRFHAPKIDRSFQSLSAVLRLEVPEAGAPTHVEVVYPTSDVLPANLLKFYIHFSAPMNRGAGHDYIRLVRSDGSTVEDPFPEIGVELWDNEQKRFTVLLDPGRIKRGIRINEEMGLPLVPGKSYRLEIDRAWPDANGNAMSENYTKSFRVVEPDHESPQPQTWSIQAPQAGTTDPLVVAIPRPLDAALLEQMVWLVDATGSDVAGLVRLEEAETRWLLEPGEPWVPGTYSLHIHPRLEDLAGNQVRRPFEQAPSDSPEGDAGREVTFEIVIP